MYFPYLRGKQFELIALKELVADIDASGLVHPVIEPVRDIDAGNTLVRNLAFLAKAEIPCTVIVNPLVGDMPGISKSASLLRHLDPLFKENKHMRLGIHLSDESEVSALLDITNASARRYGVDLFYSPAAISNEVMSRLANSAEVHVHFAEDKGPSRRYRSIFPSPRTALLKDNFSRKVRNQDYYDLSESIFTEDNIYFREDNYIGLADYQTIGRGFAEGGSLPRVVAIHLTYQKRDDEAIFVRHFCSTPNGSSADTAGKYLEALSKLVAFADDSGLENGAIQTFRNHLHLQTFPGLGVIKKLSIQNHVHVMIKALRLD